MTLQTETRDILGVRWTPSDTANLLYLAARRGDGYLSRRMCGSVRPIRGEGSTNPTWRHSVENLIDDGWVSAGPFGSLTKDDVAGHTWDAWQEGQLIRFSFRLPTNKYKRSPEVSMSSRNYHALFHGYGKLSATFLCKLVQLGYSAPSPILGVKGGDAQE